MLERDVFWLAGLFEGEGWFGLHKQNIRGKEYLNPAASIKMVDADIIYYVKRLIGNGSISTVLLPSTKTAYNWRTSGISAINLMKTLYPQMGTRRQGQMNLVFEAWKIKQEGKKFTAVDQSDLLDLMALIDAE